MRAHHSAAKASPFLNAPHRVRSPLESNASLLASPQLWARNQSCDPDLFVRALTAWLMAPHLQTMASMLKKILHTITLSAALMLSACVGEDVGAGADSMDVDYGVGADSMDECRWSCLDSSCGAVEGCPALSRCQVACDGDEACQEQCMEAAPPLARGALMAAVMCVLQNCELEWETVEDCSTCVAGTACGQDDSCEALVSCTQRCGAEESCKTNCKSGVEASVLAGAEAALTRCSQACSAE